MCQQVWYCLLVAPQVQLAGRVARNSTSHPPPQVHQVWVVGMPPPSAATLVQIPLVGWWALPAQQPGLVLVLVGRVVGALSTPRMIPPPHTVVVAGAPHPVRRLGALVRILVVVSAPPPASAARHPAPAAPRVVVVVQVVGLVLAHH